MEDLSRNLAQSSQVTNPGHTRKETKSWTLLLIGDLGKMVSFRVTKPWLVALTIGAATIVGFGIFAVVSYHAIRVENTALKEELYVVRADIEAASRATQVRLMTPEISTGQGEKKIKSASDEETTAKGPEAAKTDAVGALALVSEANGTGRGDAAYPPHREGASSAPAPRLRETTHPIYTARVLVEKLELKQDPDDTALKFQFHLKNVDPEGRRISGYTFAVLEPVKHSPEFFRPCPRVALDDGKPSLFSKGEPFSVARFKVVRGTFSDVGTVDHYGIVTVYVYSKTGDLLMEEGFELSKVLQL